MCIRDRSKVFTDTLIVPKSVCFSNELAGFLPARVDIISLRLIKINNSDIALSLIHI